jgi:membrane protease YdiL (CAAX protease family)
MKLKKISNFYVLLTISVGSFLLLVTFVGVFNPREVGFIDTLVPLGLIWIFLVSLMRLAAATFNRQNKRLLTFASFIIPSSIVLGLMFSALGEVSVLEALLLVVLAVLGNFYLARTWPK